MMYGAVFHITYKIQGGTRAEAVASNNYLLTCLAQKRFELFIGFFAIYIRRARFGPGIDRRSCKSIEGGARDLEPEGEDSFTPKLPVHPFRQPEPAGG